MSEFSDADRYLIDLIRRGDQDGWRQLVQRYQGRLRAFAAKQLSAQDAEDAVQETFLSFLNSLHSFEARASIETFLFTILRRRIVDAMRQKGRVIDARTCDLGIDREGDDHFEQLPEPRVLAASVQATLDEEAVQQRAVLSAALEQTVRRLQTELRFQDLQLIELVVHAQQRNRQIADRLRIPEKTVALKKHRFLKKIAQIIRDQAVEEGAASTADCAPPDTLLTEVWETLRPTCPKRSTLGKYMLGTLDAEWKSHIQFHLDELGCRFCRANLEDLNRRDDEAEADAACDQILQSSIGFFRPT